MLNSSSSFVRASASRRSHVMLRVAAGEISKYAVPEHVEFVESLPKTSVGKLDKKAMRSTRLAGAVGGKEEEFTTDEHK